MKERISLEHGEGGELTHRLIRDLFVQYFGHTDQAKLDAALILLPPGRIAFTTDTFVVKPPFFQGGNIGKIAIAGTVNDLAVSGATPYYLTCGFIIEEGFLYEDLRTIVATMAEEAKKSNLRIIGGDTKVVERGSADGIFINTTGIGVIPEGRELHPEEMAEGDAVIISGTVGDHGVAILAARGELGIETAMNSDSTSLYPLIAHVRSKTDGIRMMRDPTRGGLATTLVEICEDFQVTIEIEENLIPVKPEVTGACDILGLDPLYLANEGKVILIVAREEEEKVLQALHEREEGKDAAIIGRVKNRTEGKLFLRMPIGSTRRLYRLSGMQLPRIC